jgi:hypothetical protein
MGNFPRSLTDRSKNYSYSLQIKEVFVSSDLAVARLMWTLKVMSVGSAAEAISEELGMDLFRKYPDGSWKIIRYIANEK